MQCSQAHPHSACWVLFVSITCFLTCSVSLVVVGAAAGPSSAGAECAADVFLPCAFPDADAAIQRFSKVLSFPTVSNAAAEHHVGDADVFLKLEQYLSEAYPKVWQHLTVEKLGSGGFSYLITWQGSKPDLQPAMFISHVDVVPVSPGTEQDWRYPPFSGAVAEGYIWGRGTLDVKCGVVGLLEAAGALLDEGYTPERTLLLAFGHDEEVGGFAGAGQIAAHLAAKGQRLEFIWDEGGVIWSQGMPPLTRLPLALVATAEKFYQSVGVALHSPGGHSSMPPVDSSSVGARLGAFLSSLSASPPTPRLVSPTRELVAGLVQLSSPWLQLLARLLKVFPATWVDRAVAGAMAASSGPTAALVRDTAALTSLVAGVADNVLPQAAQLSINFRLLPGTPVSDPLTHVLRWLGPNAAYANVTLKPTGFLPSTVTGCQGPAFRMITAAIQEGWKFSEAAGAKLEGSGVPVLPYLMPGGTDSKHYQNLTDSIVRFCPYSVSPQELQGVHGTNERIAVADFMRLLCTYRAGLRLAGAGGMGKRAATASV